MLSTSFLFFFRHVPFYVCACVCCANFYTYCVYRDLRTVVSMSHISEHQRRPEFPPSHLFGCFEDFSFCGAVVCKQDWNVCPVCLPCRQTPGVSSVAIFVNRRLV